MSPATPPDLFGRLVHDAATVPPGNAAMSGAVPAYLRWSSTRYAQALGWFRCQAARLPQCAAQLDGDTRLGVTIVAESVDEPAAALDFCARNHRLVPRAVELTVPATDRPAQATRTTLTELPAAGAVPVYLEVPRAEGWDVALDVLAKAGAGARLRAGGPTPTDAPPAAGVATFIHSCAVRSVPFVCGDLDGAIRREDPSLGPRHGFLNVLAATHAAVNGGSSSDLVDVLEETSAEAVRAALPRNKGDVTTARSLFHGFDSTGVSEPMEELERLALLV